MSSIGERIRSLREKREWSQLPLAEKVGINNSVLSRIESGNRKVEDQELAKFADIFDVSADDLLGRENRYAGRAFFGGADQYTEDELEVARAAAEAYRKSKLKKK